LPAGSELALELTGLARRFGLRWALRGIAMRVEAGQVVAVLGRNGSGKTTLLRIVATALRPTRGGGRVHGLDLVQQAGEVRARVGYFPYVPGLYDDLTAAENLAFSLRMVGLRPDRRELAAVLEQVGLGRDIDERARFFSSGMRRRLALARLLLRPPQLLLLDEPYSSLDEEGIAQVDAFVRDVRRRGGAVLLATHDVDRVSTLADATVRLEAGLRVDGGAPLGEAGGGGRLAASRVG
jgi:heme exporter protein A